jgi:hypothetical protein
VVAALLEDKTSRVAHTLQHVPEHLGHLVARAVDLRDAQADHLDAVADSALLAIGTVLMTLLGRRDDIITTAITTAVVIVVAEMRASG